MNDKLTEEQKRLYFSESIKCDICKGYLAACMVTPIRCPGKDYREIGGKLVPYTTTGIPWDEYINGFKERDKKRREDYYNEHKEHLDKHIKERTELIKGLSKNEQ